MNVKTRKQEQYQATRAKLLAVARDVFTRHGFADAATEEVVVRAEVTRGALYYHFRDKKDLFRAVFEELEKEIVARIEKAAVPQPTSWEALVAGSHAFLDACLDPAVRRIVLLDAPAVLGWDEWRRIDMKYGFGSLQEGLRAAIEAGHIDRQPVLLLTHVLSGALNEAALVIAEAADTAKARAEMGAVVDWLLERLKRPAA